MLNENVKITGIGTYHPSQRVGNDYYIEHFKKRGMDIEDLLNHLGRKYRYISNDKNETVITMGINAAKKALEQANKKPEEIDMIVFVSDTPEYTAPSNAIKVHHILGAKNAHIAYDMNCNCVGMITAIDQVSRYLQSNKNVKNVLIVGGVLISRVARMDDPINFAAFGDSGAAIVLEKKEEEVKSGFVDSIYHTDSCQHNVGLMPGCGYSKIYREDINKEDKKWKTTPFDASFLSKLWVDMINDISKCNNIKPEKIDHFIFSQFSKPTIVETLTQLDISLDKYTFVGDEYGYTGVTSPVFALERALNTKKITKGSNVILCSIGTGYTTTAVLYKF